MWGPTLKPKNKRVVMTRRGIDLFPFYQQRIRHPAPVEQLKPLHRIASETGNLQTKHRTYTTMRDLVQ